MHIQLNIAEASNHGRSELELICEALGAFTRKHNDLQTIAMQEQTTGLKTSSNEVTEERIRQLDREGQSLTDMLDRILNHPPAVPISLRLSYIDHEDGSRSELKLLCDALAKFTATRTHLLTQCSEELDRGPCERTFNKVKAKSDTIAAESKTLSLILEKIVSA